MVLNHILLDYGRIPQGVMRGLLLGRSFTSMPEVYHHGTEVRAILHLIDHADKDHFGEVSLWVDRSALTQRGERRQHKFCGLYGPGEHERTNQDLHEVSNPVDATDVNTLHGQRRCANHGANQHVRSAAANSGEPSFR